MGRDPRQPARCLLTLLEPGVETISREAFPPLQFHGPVTHQRPELAVSLGAEKSGCPSCLAAP